eukprot:1150287-Prorocentrum_minimum.AAC.3
MPGSEAVPSISSLLCVSRGRWALWPSLRPALCFATSAILDRCSKQIGTDGSTKRVPFPPRTRRPQNHRGTLVLSHEQTSFRVSPATRIAPLKESVRLAQSTFYLGLPEAERNGDVGELGGRVRVGGVSKPGDRIYRCDE